ncbi:MAG: ZIP family metal transporter [Actinomycetota bacterium]|nr:ZIP family metal transporter [Actinomycetota bacterium]
MEARAEAPDRGDGRLAALPLWALAGGIVALIVAVLLAIAVAGDDTLPDRLGPPIEELVVERTTLEPGQIELSLRNTGPDPVQVGQVFVNDVYADFDGAEAEIGRLGSEKITISYPWGDEQPYLIALVTSTGVVIEYEIAAAVETPQADGDLFALMALLGLYVGVIPVVLGMLLLPAMRRFDSRWIRLVMAVTVGLLAFLAVDATLEGLELAGESGGAFGGSELVLLGAGLAYLALTGVDRFLTARRERQGAGAGGASLALMIAIGIGLHNMGEGLAIGSAYAIGELALGAALVVGFAIHNTTEGFAIVAPLIRERRPSIPSLLGLGLIAGAPAILGAMIGASVTNPELSALLLGLGVGAVVQVIVQIAPSMRDSRGRALDALTAAGIAAGAIAFYLTGLLITV